MLSLSVSKRTIDLSQYRRRRASLDDCSRLISEDAIVSVDNAPVLAYYHRVPGDFATLRAALDRIKYHEGFRATRNNPMFTRARTFGYAPRLEIRNQPCRMASLGREQPLEHAVLLEAAEVAYRCYCESFPQRATSHDELATKVLDTYRIGKTPFTSGIVNANNPLPYHFDRGNFRGVNSAMLGFKRDIEGGHLTIPELDLAFDIGDQSLLLFDGQSLLHGVTPFRRVTDQAMRYTIVFYSLEGMWRCEPPGEELRHFNRNRTRNERARADKNKEPA